MSGDLQRHFEYKGTLVKVGPVSQLHNVAECNIVLCGLYLRIHGGQ